MSTAKDVFVDIANTHLTTEFNLASSLCLGEKQELLSLLNTSYPHWEIDNVFEDYPSYKQLYVFSIRCNDKLIASRQFLILDTNTGMPSWVMEMRNILSIRNIAIGSRAIVHPDFRKQGLGSKMVQLVNNEIFSKHSVDTIFGSSTSIAAIALYLRLGAKLFKHDANKLNIDKVPEMNHITYDKMFTQNKLPRLRLQKPIRYVYNKNTATNTWNNQLWSPYTHGTNEILLTA